MKGGAHTIYTDLHCRYGKIVRVAPNKVSISDPEIIPVVYGISSKYNKVVCSFKVTSNFTHTE